MVKVTQLIRFVSLCVIHSLSFGYDATASRSRGRLPRDESNRNTVSMETMYLRHRRTQMRDRKAMNVFTMKAIGTNTGSRHGTSGSLEYKKPGVQMRHTTPKTRDRNGKMKTIVTNNRGAMGGRKKNLRGKTKPMGQVMMSGKNVRMSRSSVSKGKGNPRPPIHPPADGCSGCSKSCIEVSDFFLVSSFNETRLLPIQSGDVLNLEFLESLYGVSDFSVECLVAGEAGGVNLVDNLGNQVVDNEGPFTLPVMSGNVEITCQAFCGASMTGEASRMKTISLTIESVSSPTTAPTQGALEMVPTASPSVTTFPSADMNVNPPGIPTSAPTILPTSLPTSLPTTPLPTAIPTDTPTSLPTTSSPTLNCDVCRTGCLDVAAFNLVDLSSGATVRTLALNDSLVVTEEDFLTIECITSPDAVTANPFRIGSTLMTDNFEELEGNVENFPPFYLSGGNTQTMRSPFFENPGTWVVTCQTYCTRDLQGDASPVRSITFDVVQG